MVQRIISMVLTTFNSENTIEDVMKSIVEQDYPLSKIELIIVDGGSKDNTLAVLDAFLKKYSGVFYATKLIVHDKNYGLSRARNDGIRSSHGEYILILDDDVILDKTTIKELVEFLEKQPSNVGGVMPLHLNIPESKLDWLFRKIKENKISEVSAIASCVLLRREMIERIGLYDETLGLPLTMGEEIEYWARARRHGFRILLAGHIKVLHAIDADYWINMKGIRDLDIETSKINPSKGVLLMRAGRTIRSLLKKSYIYAYRRYFSSAPISIKIKWIFYLLIHLLTILVLILLLLSITLQQIRNILGPTLLTYIVLMMVTYLTVVREYWNSKVPHISLMYSAIAYIWRVVRAIALIIPINRSPDKIAGS